MITRVENGQTHTQTFDIENRLASVTVSGQTTQFIYDGDGNLVKKVKPDGSKTLYAGGIYEVDKTSGGSVTRTVTYYPVSGAMRINSTLYYTLKDHLGSASVVTDASGTVVGEDRFCKAPPWGYPYEETRFTTGSMYTDHSIRPGVIRLIPTAQATLRHVAPRPIGQSHSQGKLSLSATMAASSWHRQDRCGC
jgi:YD repeat-containing protein